LGENVKTITSCALDLSCNVCRKGYLKKIFFVIDRDMRKTDRPNACTMTLKQKHMNRCGFAAKHAVVVWN